MRGAGKLIGVIAAGVAAPVLAQAAPVASTANAAPVDAARLASARILIDLMNLDATLDRLYVQLAPVFAQGVIGVMSGEPQGRAELTAIQARDNGQQRLVAILSQEFLKAVKAKYPALKQGAAEEYAAAFSQDELDAIIDFYRSAPGAKALRIMPELQQKMGLRGQELGRAAGAEAGQRAMERASREILELQPKPKT